MTTSGLHALIDRLPPELQAQVYDFASFLLERRAAPHPPTERLADLHERAKTSAGELHRDILAYATLNAGTSLDLDENLEATALEVLDDAV